MKYSDHEKVLNAAKTKLADNKDFSVFQQYPAEISNRRKELLPHMHELRRQGNRDVRLVMDKLYVGNQLVNPPIPAPNMPIQQQNVQPGPSFTGPQHGPHVAPQFRPPGPQFVPQNFRPPGPRHEPPLHQPGPQFAPPVR